MIQWCNDSGKIVTTEAANLAAVAASIASGHQAFNFAGCCLQSQKDGDHHQISGQVRYIIQELSFREGAVLIYVACIDAPRQRDEHQRRVRRMLPA